MTEPDRERSLDETQPIQTPVAAEPAATTPPVTTNAAEAEAAASTPAAAGTTPWWEAGGTATQPVQSAGRGTGARWAIAAVLIVAVVGVAAGAAMLLTGRAAAPDAFAYLPANTAMVFELRPDLPGDQREKLARFVSKFPGFADQSTFDQKLDEALDRVADSAAGRDVDYPTEVKPYLANPVVVGVTKVPDSEEPPASADGFVVIFTSTATASCPTPPAGQSTQNVTHAGHSILVVEDSGTDYACVVDGQNVLLGGLDDVKLALDTKNGSSSLAGDSAVEHAREKLGGDTLGLIYISKTAMDQITRLAEQQQSAQGLPVTDFSAMPDWMVMGLRAEGDGMLFDIVMPMPEVPDGASPLPSLEAPRVSAIASRLPSTTVAAFEARQLGTTIDLTLDQFAAMPDAAEGMRQLETALAFLGGRDALLSWLDDASVVITRDGETFGGGLVIATPDGDKATATLNQLKAILGMAGAEGITVSEEAYKSGTITTVSFDVATLMNAGGFGNDLGPDVPETIDLAYTVQDGLVVFGAGSAFVKDVLDTTAGQSLADQPRYQAAMRLVGETNTGQGYLDLSAGIDAIEELALPLAGADVLTEWERDIAPFVEPLDAIAFVGTADGDFIRFRMAVTAHQPQQ